MSWFLIVFVNHSGEGGSNCFYLYVETRPGARRGGITTLPQSG